MKKALLVIDVQNEYFTGNLKVTYPNPAVSLSNILKVMDQAKQIGMPIIVIQHTENSGTTFVKNTESWDLHPALLTKTYPYRIEKTKPSSFYETNLENILQKEAVQGLVIVGYMTQMCCDTTAREGFHKGYSVEFLADATGTINVSNAVGTISGEALHKAALITQSLGFSRVLSTKQWLAEESLILRDQ
jgi:nicotinamidase-related amidase